MTLESDASINLERLLAEGTADQRLDVIDVLAGREDTESFRILLSAFNNSYWFIRRAAATRVVQRGDSVIPMIEAQLASCSDDEAYWAIYCLRQFGNRAIHLLVAYLEHPGTAVVTWALKAIGDLKAEDALPKLIESFSHPEWTIRREAARAIERIDSPKTIALLHETYLENIHSQGNEDICYWSIKLLGKMAGQKAVDTLVNLAASPRAFIRFNAITALGETGSDKAVPVLINCLEDPSWLNRKHAAINLEKFGPKAIPGLKEAFRKGDSDIKYWTIKILGNLLSDKAIGVFRTMLASAEKEVRYYVVTVAGAIHTPESLRLLVDAFDDDYWLIRNQASTLVSKWGDDAIPVLDEALTGERDNPRFWACNVLRILGSRGIAVIINAMKRACERDRAMMAGILASGVPTPEIDDFMVRALSNTSWRVRERAMEYLRKRGSELIPFVIDYLVSPPRKGEETLYWALRYLSAFQRESIQEIIKRLESSPDAVASVILKTLNVRLEDVEEAPELGMAGTHESVRPLKSVAEYLKDLNNPNDRARLEAVLALGTIDEDSIAEKIRVKTMDSSEEVREAAVRVLRRAQGVDDVQDSDAEEAEVEISDEKGACDDEALKVSMGSTGANRRISIILALVVLFSVMAGEYYLLRYFEKGRTVNLAVDMKHAIALRKLGNVFQERGEIDKALVSYREALRMTPSYPNAYLDMAIAAYRSKDMDGALDNLLLAEKYRDNDWDRYSEDRHITFLVWGNILTLKRDFRAAVEKYRQALRLKPDYSEARKGYESVKGFLESYLDKKE
ncbi:MAG: hypothetical protein CVV64_10445 [Candidatus Wallbacteria bacterium HGW-Wallbacteria-1]|jgi:HEAT repeat protein|uniref:Uncharacterized protein n=1 Tax=Candidatus Wallbacteria bacterium HGW-Wallbacteria-1 TaxID=2013854 RepID=A0A2N1PP87_9BACT|nr:MAG: hypothetical protein CVV64_10445 [Candidatus Wallbacteria bacterium HGW-Wallbacteria-1]